ncbi:hypothetical protein [Capnocytophaga leadbetteri]
MRGLGRLGGLGQVGVRAARAEKWDRWKGWETGYFSGFEAMIRRLYFAHLSLTLRSS